MIELKKYFDYVLDNYLLPENGTFSSNMEYYKVIVNKIPEEIGKLFDNRKYKIYGSCGKGAKSASPYIAILDRNITTSTQRGIYVDFIFKSDMSGFYLTIDQGITSIKEKYGNKASEEKAKNAANYFRSLVSDLGIFKAGLVSVHIKSGSLEEGYENARVIAKYYDAKNYNNDEVVNDLKNIMRIYDEIVEKMNGKSYEEIIQSLDETDKSGKQYWTYSPGEGGSEWDYCVKNNKMVIGFDLVGDLTKYDSRDSLANQLRKVYGKENPYNDISACDDFVNKLKPGDIVIAKIGQKQLLGYGIVKDDEYIYDTSREHYRSIRNVEWKMIGKWDLPNELKVAQKTLTDITPYGNFVKKLLNIIEGENNMNIDSCEWIIPANPKYYDHDGAFEKFGFIDWSQHVNFSVGDIVYIYSGAPESRLTAITSVEKTDMSFSEKVDDSEFYKADDLENKNQNRDRFVRLRIINKLDDPRLNYDNLAKHGLNSRPQSALRVTKELSNYINGIINGNDIDEYSKDDFLKEVFISSEKYDSIVSILERKNNIILEGAPGVGKTFIAKRLAYSLIGREDSSKIKLIQFHQNYSYEDFIEGYRPTENGFKLEKGIFYNFCECARNDPENDYYMVIDEINRGNLSKIFGELLMLIECDKRGDKNKLTLAYSKEEFYVPENLYIIGLMNTADRSLALIDYALRRRFSFIRIEPAFDNKLFIDEFNKKFDAEFDSLIEIIKSINNAIEHDKSLGSGFEIGHSYFLPKLKDEKGNKKTLEDIVKFEIIPLLEEYWYDDEDTLIKWKDSLTGYFK